MPGWGGRLLGWSIPPKLAVTRTMLSLARAFTPQGFTRTSTTSSSARRTRRVLGTRRAHADPALWTACCCEIGNASAGLSWPSCVRACVLPLPFSDHEGFAQLRETLAGRRVALATEASHRAPIAGRRDGG